jgi:hypothetical protein
MNDNQKPHIKVVQYMYGGFEYFQWSEKINRHYCERHGYEYAVSHDKPRTDRHINWQKQPTMIKELHHCDYLLFLDADAHFYSHELTIENELLPLMGDKNILMAQDVGCETERWTPGKPNSGVILMKNNSSVREFLEYWNQATEIDESTRWQRPVEQRGLWNVALLKFPDFVKVENEYYLIQGRYGQFIRHFMLMSDKERTKKMKTFCKSRKIE